MKIENIKFKAKRIDNGEWVKGDLVHSTSYVCISYSSDEFADVPIVHRVDPKTVCQFTGLTDCKGKEIWEGDVVEREIYDFFKGIDIRKAVIEYIGGAFVAVTDGIPYSICSKYINVIGNKFDDK